MAGEFTTLTPEEKVQKAFELLDAGHNKTEISSMLYNTATTKDSLNSLRKLMLSHGYVWDKETNRYIQKSEQTKTNNEQTKSTVQSDKPILTEDEILALKEIVLFKSDLEAFRGVLQGSADISIGELVPEAPLTFTKFKGLLQPTTLQLHQEVWEALDDFCKQYKLSKKAVVNEAILDFLKKWGN